MSKHTTHPQQLKMDLAAVKLCECGCGQPAPIAKHNNAKSGHIKGQPVRFVKGHNSRQKKPVEVRFWGNVDRRNPDECWGWTGTKDKLGYGFLKINKINKKAYRLSYELHYGPIPNGLCVLHHCDNPSCVNPQHLFVGTRQDNIYDMVSKRRHHYGEKTPGAKLTERQVKEIRQASENGALIRELANHYQVGETAIHDIIHRHTWKHIP